MMDHMRLNKYRALYTGPARPGATRALKVKSANDKTALRFMRSPPDIYAVTNIQSRPPLSMHMPVERHREPTLLFDASTRFRQTQARNRAYYQGGGLYNQQIQRTIAELSRLR
jgi:hypothetical protein